MWWRVAKVHIHQVLAQNNILKLHSLWFLYTGSRALPEAKSFSWGSITERLRKCVFETSWDDLPLACWLSSRYTLTNSYFLRMWIWSRRNLAPYIYKSLRRISAFISLLASIIMTDTSFQNCWRMSQIENSRQLFVEKISSPRKQMKTKASRKSSNFHHRFSVQLSTLDGNSRFLNILHTRKRTPSV